MIVTAESTASVTTIEALLQKGMNGDGIYLQVSSLGSVILWLSCTPTKRFLRFVEVPSGHPLTKGNRAELKDTYVGIVQTRKGDSSLWIAESPTSNKEVRRRIIEFLQEPRVPGSKITDLARDTKRACAGTKVYVSVVGRKGSKRATKSYTMGTEERPVFDRAPLPEEIPLIVKGLIENGGLDEIFHGLFEATEVEGPITYKRGDKVYQIFRKEMWQPAEGETPADNDDGVEAFDDFDQLADALN